MQGCGRWVKREWNNNEKLRKNFSTMIQLKWLTRKGVAGNGDGGCWNSIWSSPAVSGVQVKVVKLWITKNHYRPYLIPRSFELVNGKHWRSFCYAGYYWAANFFDHVCFSTQPVDRCAYRPSFGRWSVDSRYQSMFCRLSTHDVGSQAPLFFFYFF